jgi:hypothetical protein
MRNGATLRSHDDDKVPGQRGDRREVADAAIGSTVDQHEAGAFLHALKACHQALPAGCAHVIELAGRARCRDHPHQRRGGKRDLVKAAIAAHDLIEVIAGRNAKCCQDVVGRRVLVHHDHGLARGRQGHRRLDHQRRPSAGLATGCEGNDLRFPAAKQPAQAVGLVTHPPEALSQE